MTSNELGGADRLYPRVTIDTLPDNVLLEIFELYLGKADANRFDYKHDYNRWQTLVDVCCRWKYVVFASPRRLDLALSIRPSANSKSLDIWPALPIVIWAPAIRSKEEVINIIVALRERDRVRKIYYDEDRDIRHSLLKEIAAIDEPFPALTTLDLASYAQNMPVLPDSFLGGSAPLLRSLYLRGIPYPSIGILLSSTTNLVSLFLWDIPRSGYISPETIVPLLSMLPELKSLGLGLEHPRSRAHRSGRHPPPLARVVFPNLTDLGLCGDIEYSEDILSQIETPILNQCNLYLFNQLVFDTPLLGYFIRRTETFMRTHGARVTFSPSYVEVSLEERPNSYEEALQLNITCQPLDWQLSAVVQILNSFLSFLPHLESLDLGIECDDHYPQGELEPIQWREFLRPLTSVKDMALRSQDLVELVAPALQELAGEKTTEVLPALQNLFIWTLSHEQPLSGPDKEAIEQFSATRQHPVTVHYYDDNDW